MKTNSIINQDYKRNKYSLSNPSIWKKLEKIKGKDFVQYRKLLAQAEKGKIVTDFPIEILVKTTLNCNHKCLKCLHGMGIFPKGPQYTMTFDTLKKVLDEGKKKGLKSVVFTGGEPFLHPQIIDFITYAGRLNFPDLSVVSNGALMSDEIIDCLIKSGVTRINISLDAITSDTYEKIRGVKDLDKVISRIEALRKARRKKNSKLPFISVSFVLSEENAHEVDDFVKFWEKRADGGIKIYPYKNIISIVDDEFKNTYGQGEKNREDVFPGLIPVALSKKIPVVSHYDNKQCMTPWYRCHVGINGELQACTTHGFCDHPQMVMGNIHKCSFEDAWKSKRWSFLREITLKKEFDKHPVCYKCQRSM